MNLRNGVVKYTLIIIKTKYSIFIGSLKYLREMNDSIVIVGSNYYILLIMLMATTEDKVAQ